MQALEHGCSLEEDPAQYQQWCVKMVKTSLNNTGSSFNMNDHLQRVSIAKYTYLTPIGCW